MNQSLKYCNTADEYYNTGDFFNAISFYKKAFETDNDEVIAIRIASVYEKISKFEYIDEQLKWIKKAVEINPESTLAYRNLAIMLSKICRFDEAQIAYKKLLELKPIKDDLFAYACFCFRQKNFKEAWKYFDYRFEKLFGKTDYPNMNKPKWNGEKTNKTLLINYEQGFGDSIQFCRFIDLVKPIVGKVIFRVQNQLYDLMKENFVDIEVVSGNNSVSELDFDMHIPLMSLPCVLNLSYEQIPQYKNNLIANLEKSNFYKKKYFDNDNFKIGISFEGSTLGNVSRNIPLKNFLALKNIPNVKLYSLQKNCDNLFNDPMVSDIIVNLGTTFENFSDTAAALSCLDLFVTSDNVLLNLAGAMNIKTELLLSKDSEWRWFDDDKKTIWYNSVEIFKKKSLTEGWENLFSDIVSQFT